MNSLKNEIWVGLLVLTAIAVGASLTALFNSGKNYSAAFRDMQLVTGKLPVLSVSKNDFSAAQYDAILLQVSSDDAIKIDAMNSKITVSAKNIVDEQKWRQVVASILSLDKKLYVKKVCGSVTNVCTDAALVAEIVGSRQVILIKE